MAYPVGCWLPSIWRRRMLVLLAQSWCYRFVSSRTWAKSAKCGTLGSNLTLPTLTSCRLRVSLAAPGYNMCTHALVSEELKFGRIHTHGPIVVRVDLADPPTLFFFFARLGRTLFFFLVRQANTRRALRRRRPAPNSISSPLEMKTGQC